MCLEDGFNLFNRDLPSIIKGVERFSEGLSALRTFEALIAFAGSIVLVSFRVVTVGTLHDASPDLSNPDDESHLCLVHKHRFYNWQITLTITAAMAFLTEIPAVNEGFPLVRLKWLDEDRSLGTVGGVIIFIASGTRGNNELGIGVISHLLANLLADGLALTFGNFVKTIEHDKYIALIEPINRPVGGQSQLSALR